MFKQQSEMQKPTTYHFLSFIIGFMFLLTFERVNIIDSPSQVIDWTPIYVVNKTQLNSECDFYILQ